MVVELSLVTGLDVVVARRRAGLKQYELAQRLGISSTILCDLEHDRRELTPDLVERVLAACSQEKVSATENGGSGDG